MLHKGTGDSLVGEGNPSHLNRGRSDRGPGFALLDIAGKAQPSPRLQIWGRFSRRKCSGFPSVKLTAASGGLNGRVWKESRSTPRNRLQSML